MVQESEKPYRYAKEYVDKPLHDQRIRKTLLYRERKAFEGGIPLITGRPNSKFEKTSLLKIVKSETVGFTK